MTQPMENVNDQLNAAINIAQYLSRLMPTQNLWKEVGNLMTSFFNVDLVIFASKEKFITIFGHEWKNSSEKISNLFSKEYFVSKSANDSENHFELIIKEGIEEVFNTGFVTWRKITSPLNLALSFFPINQDHNLIKIMVIVHEMTNPLSKEILNLYLSIAELVGTTAARLASEIELKEHRLHLEKIVRERTYELTQTNIKLQLEMTERKQAEQKLNQLQKTESLSRMAGAIAHNYNNLLTVVIGNLELLSLDYSDNVELNEAKEAAIRASEIGELMLSYLGQSEIQIETFDLAKVIQETALMFEKRIPHTINLKIHINIPGPMIKSDKKQIQRSLEILMMNAIESMENKPGIISIIVDLSHLSDFPYKKCIPVDFTPEFTKYAYFEVIDQGGGISESNLSKIGDPFFTTKFTGRGMGLPVLLGFIKAQKGCLMVKTAKNRGSRFRVYLPMK